jgi:hypothetical protein
MDVFTILLGTGAALVAILLIMLVILVTNPQPKQSRKKVKEDIKKIKEQINSE